MDELTHKILTDEILIANRENWFRRMQALFDGKSTEKIYLYGILPSAQHPDWAYTNPEAWMKECANDLAKKASTAVSDKLFVPVCMGQSPYGVHLVDKIFGAEVFFQDGQWYNRYLNHEVGALQKPNLEENEVWQLAKRQAEAFLALNVTVPVYAMPVIASALNIAVNLYGEEILAAMLEDPEAAHHDLQIINEVLIEIHQWYRCHIPMQQLQPFGPAGRLQPPGYGQLCGCTTQLLSPNLYKEFIFSLDNALLGVHPNGGMIHLCGSHEHLIPLFATMENLKSVQLNDRAAEQLEFYVKGLREDQVIYLHPCKGMPVERALEIANNRGIVIWAKQE